MGALRELPQLLDELAVLPGEAQEARGDQRLQRLDATELVRAVRDLEDRDPHPAFSADPLELGRQELLVLVRLHRAVLELPDTLVLDDRLDDLQLLALPDVGFEHVHDAGGVMDQEGDDRRVVPILPLAAEAWIAGPIDRRVTPEIPDQVLDGAVLIVPVVDLGRVEEAALLIDGVVLLLAIKTCLALAQAQLHELVVALPLGPEDRSPL